MSDDPKQGLSPAAGQHNKQSLEVDCATEPETNVLAEHNGIINHDRGAIHIASNGSDGMCTT